VCSWSPDPDEFDQKALLDARKCCEVVPPGSFSRFIKRERPMDGTICHDHSDHDPLDPVSTHLAVIKDAIGYVTRRRRLSRDEGQEFAGVAMLRLLENDCAILRRFEGRSSLRTFLVVAIDRMFLDYRIARWGKWRSSAAARDLGPVARSLETLMRRDGLSFDEASETLRLNHSVSMPSRELEAMLERLPVRCGRRFVGEEALEHLALDAPGPELPLLRPHAVRTLKALRRALSQLTAAERTLIRMRFVEARPVSDIARARNVGQKTLYRIFDRLLARLKADLECEGIIASDVRSWLGRLDLTRGAAPEKAAWRPSIDQRDCIHGSAA
jgi:RNA polymerase sigma factor (sigma-70 family)